MKQTLLQRISLRATLLVALMCAAFTGVRADEVTLKYTGTTTTNMTGDGNEAATLGLDASEWSVVADKGAASNNVGLNKAGDFRLYWHADGGSTLTVSSLKGATINSIAITFNGNSYSNVSVTVNGTAVTGTNGAYTINSSSFVLGNANTSNVQVRISQVVIDYTPSGAPVVEKVAKPTFSVEAGVYTQTQRVELSTTTEGAIIYYTTDGTEPTVNSTPYTGAISVGQTMTINAIAVKEGMDNSAVASATYKFPVIDHAGTEADPYTVADARAAIDLNTGLTGVYVIGTVSEIVTEYNSKYGNVTFDLVDQVGDTETLRAYRCSVTSADAVKVGDVVTVTGDLTLYNDEIYEFASGCTLVTPPVPTVTVDQTELNVTAAEANGTIAVTYNNISNVVAEVQFLDATGAIATYDWIAADINADNNIDYVVEANTGEERTAYMKVYALDDETNDVYSEVITVTQAAYVAPAVGQTYTLATAITSGKHYVIASGTDGTVQVMGEQKSNNRGAVAATVTATNGVLTVASNAGAAEVVIVGPDANGYYTIYDAAEGYLYAASKGSNYLRSKASVDGNGLWEITFDGGVATVKAQGENTRNWMRYNSGSTLFSCYGSGQDDIYLYEKDDDRPVAADYNRAVTAGNYGTICLPNTATVTGAQLYSIAGVDNAKAPTSLTLTEVYGTAEAGVPYIFKATEATLNAYYTGDAATEAETVNGLVGSFTGTPVEAGKYVIKNNAICPAGEGVTIGANKAYINLTDVPTSSTMGSVKLFINSDADAICAINAESRNEAIYNVAGQRLQKVQKGVNIVGGKKIIVK